MNDPIFNPWLFYFIDMIDGVSIVLTVMTIISTISFVVTTGGSVITNCIAHDEMARVEERKVFLKYHELWSKYRKIATTFFTISLFLIIFLPSKITVYKMIVASYTTPANVTKTIQAGKEFKDEMKKDLFELIDKFHSDKEDNKKGDKK